MTLTTEQSVAMNARPRMTEAEVEQMIVMRANGMSAAEIAERFPQYAAGTVFNKLSKRKAQVEDLRRARSVQFEDIPGVRKPSRVNDSWELRTVYRMLFRAHVDSCFAANPETGEREFVEQLVDARKLKVYSDAILKANRAIAEELGQLPQAAPGLPQTASHYNLVGSSNLHLVDQGGDWTPRSVTYGRKLTDAEKDARAQPVLDYWQAITDELRGRLDDLKAGRDPGPQSEMLEAAWAVSVEERAEWAASNAVSLERTVGAAENRFAEPEPVPELEPEPEPEPDVPLVDVRKSHPGEAAPPPSQPPPGFSASDGEWVLADD